MVYGLPREFFTKLSHQEKPAKRRASTFRPDPDLLPPLDSESELESTEESDLDEPSPPASGSRARGSRASRGGRGRGGRGRGGRGRGRGRGSGVPASNRDVSPVRARLFRNAAPTIPLTEEDDEPSNQESPTEYAKDLTPLHEDAALDDASSDDQNDEEVEHLEALKDQKDTPVGTPSAPRASLSRTDSSTKFKPLPAPRISQPRKSGSQTPLEIGSTTVELSIRPLLNPEDDVLSDSDLPSPWIEGLDPPIEAECEDRADFLLRTKFKPLTEVQDIINALTKYHVSQRSTENLYLLAENTQRILREWQDEYLALDARVRAQLPERNCLLTFLRPHHMHIRQKSPAMVAACQLQSKSLKT